MKGKRILALFLLLAILATVFCGCELKNSSLEKSDALSSLDNSDSCAVASYESCCYSIITNADEPDNITNSYNYGDEIDICISMQFHPTFLGIGPYDHVRASVTVKESPAFEIVGEATANFDFQCEQNYMCNHCDPGEREYMTFNLKIKVNEESFGINLIEFDSKFTVQHYSTYNPETGEGVFSREYEIKNPMGVFLKFVTDSQGIVINSIPFSYNHYYDGGSSTYYDFDFIRSDTLVSESYNREYKNGVSLEELIVRHLRNEIGNDFYFRFREVRELKFKFWFIRIYEVSHSVEYISEDIRLKMYFSEDDEEYERIDRDRSEGRKFAVARLLEAALSHGLISSQEYNNEISRLKNPETTGSKPSLSNWNRMPEIESLQLDFEFPSDDSYYNYVADRRSGDEKIEIGFKFGKD